MRLKLISMVVAFAFVAACETAPEQSAASSGTGASTSSTSSTSTTSSTTSTAPVAPQPQGPQAGSQEDLVVNVGDRVFFGFDKYNLTGEARGVLEKQAAWLKRYPSVTVMIEGHADERGTREYNLGLGDRRANSVKDYLVALGISPGRIKTISYGKERPVALGSNEQAWAQNRRGVTTVTRAAGS